MTKRERAIKDRMWLKIRKFAITKSLNAKLEASNLTDEEKEWCCYIQNKVLMVLRRFDQAQIASKYFKTKIGPGYVKYIRLLQEWGELTRSKHYIPSGPITKGQNKTCGIPTTSLESGTMIRNFKAERAKGAKDKSDLSSAEPWIQFIHNNLKCLSIAKTLKEIPDPETDSATHHDAGQIVFENFNVRRGDRCRRLFHSVIEMPKEGRASLIWRRTEKPVECEYDVKSCHPVLLLTLVTDEEERKRYINFLRRDIYDAIRVYGSIKDTRQGCKDTWAGFVNDPNHSHEYSKNNYVYQFYKKHFPLLTDAILKRSDMALHLQNLEADIMVDEVGKECMEHGIWYVPMHDGFLCKPEQVNEVANVVSKAFYNLTRYNITIACNNFSLPSSHHIWMYNPLIINDPEWNQLVEDYKNRYPESELEHAYAQKKERRKRFKRLLKLSKTDNGEQQLGKRLYKNNQLPFKAAA
jgi:hypothetical protein